MTEQKQQHVPSAIDKTELTYWLEEAGKLNSSDYTKDGWDIFRQIVTEATGVKDDATATEHEVSEAVIALIDGMIALEKEKVYTVTVDGKKVAEGVYNQIVTITADAPQVGQKFAGWQLKDKIVSYDEVYTFAISGNMAFTATYAPQEQTIEKPLYAAVANTMIIKRADGKANVKYIAKLSIPDKYLVVSVLIHHGLLLTLEFFSFAHIGTLLLRIAASTLLTVTCIMAVEGIRKKG